MDDFFTALSLIELVFLVILLFDWFVHGCPDPRNWRG
jgi:hypothetical protein